MPKYLFRTSVVSMCKNFWAENFYNSVNKSNFFKIFACNEYFCEIMLSVVRKGDFFKCLWGFFLLEKNIFF